MYREQFVEFRNNEFKKYLTTYIKETENSKPERDFWKKYFIPAYHETYDNINNTNNTIILFFALLIIGIIIITTILILRKYKIK
jgi:hypothetical protein